jgi:hypothetical protein
MATRQLEKKKLKVHDTIGFAQYNWQLDSIYNRLGLPILKIFAMESSYKSA